MSESRVPLPPLPRPFYRVITEDPVTRDDLDRVKKNMQQTIDNLMGELKRERELSKKLEKSGEVLQEILAAPDFKALSLQVQATATAVVQRTGHAVEVDEPPIEYVDVKELDLTDSVVVDLEASEKK